MHNGYGYGSMMGFGGPDFMGAFIGIVLLVDLILLGIWLWKKISEKPAPSVIVEK